MINTKSTKKVLLLFVTSLLLLSFTFACSGCTDDDVLQIIKVDGDVFSIGEQTVNIYATSSAMGDEPASFKTSICKEDIVLSGALVGKIVKEVQFISESEINVVLDGNVNAFEGNKADGQITIKQSGLNNKVNAFNFVSVLKPYAYLEHFHRSGGTSIGYTISATIKMVCGEFISADEVEFTGNVGELATKKVENGKLLIEVINIPSNTQFPKFIFNAGATSLNQRNEMTIQEVSVVYFN